jgi:hypothetical protein
MDADGFVWLRREPGGWTLYFNFLPSSGFEGDLPEEAKQQVMRAVRDAVAQEMLRAFLHGVFAEDEKVRSAMAADGWCPTPILPARPLAADVRGVSPRGSVRGGGPGRRGRGPGELDTMLASWVSEEPFASDRRFLEIGVERYKAADYISAVSVLLPRIEGWRTGCVNTGG